MLYMEIPIGGGVADNPVWDEQEHVLRVMEQKCDTCILGPNSILLAQDTKNLVGRARSGQDGFGNVICHKTIKIFIGDGPGAICRGYWDAYGRNTIWGRLAVHENVIQWWNPPTEEKGNDEQIRHAAQAGRRNRSRRGKERRGGKLR